MIFVFFEIILRIKIKYDVVCQILNQYEILSYII